MGVLACALQPYGEPGCANNDVWGDMGFPPLSAPSRFVVKVGVVPNTEWCASAVACDVAGWVQVDRALATSRPGVWAAGDVVRPALSGVSVAAGHGALAVAAIRAAIRGE